MKTLARCFYAFTILLVSASIASASAGASLAARLPIAAEGGPADHRAVTVTAGFRHTCVLTESGGVKCWGDNRQGQLGNGDVSGAWRVDPVDVVGLTTGVIAVAAGGNSTCAITDAGAVKCWGANDSGQLGLGVGLLNPVFTPVDLPGLSSGVTGVAISGAHACAVLQTGDVKCWGANGSGQVGDGTTTPRYSPVSVVGLAAVARSVVVGGDRSCVLLDDGRVRCWGRSPGEGSTISRLPVAVPGLGSDAVALSAGLNHVCALLTAGAVRCWGENATGQIGDGTTRDRLVPVDTLGLPAPATAIAAGWGKTCALTASGAALCWGARFGSSPFIRLTPAEEGRIQAGAAAIAIGETHGCVVTTDRNVKCWTGGSSVSSAVDVPGLDRDVRRVSAGGSSTCALLVTGGVRCWGSNAVGQLGDGTHEPREGSVDVAGLGEGATDISVGDAFACALTRSGAVKCWGLNTVGQLGDGTTNNRWSPVEIPQLRGDVQALSAGYVHACALTHEGGVVCWGGNQAGQLGNGTTVDAWQPVDVVGLNEPVVAVSAGSSHTCALTETGAVWCWGGNSYGQLGDGTTLNRATPVQVSGLSQGMVQIETSRIPTLFGHSCARAATGPAQCWGGNWLGQLGDGTQTDRLTPVDVAGLGDDVASIGPGGPHTCALTVAGAAYCWGRNIAPEVGGGPSDFSLSPIVVNDMASGADALTVGSDHACVLTTAGGVRCWGLNTSGQVTYSACCTAVAVTGFGGRSGSFEIVGYVRDRADRPLPGVMIVTDAGPTAITSGDGHFRITRLPAGAVTLTARRAGYVFDPDTLVVDVGPGSGEPILTALPAPVVLYVPLVLRGVP